MDAPNWKYAPDGAEFYSAEPGFPSWFKLERGYWFFWSRIRGWMPFTGQLTVAFFESLQKQPEENTTGERANSTSDDGIEPITTGQQYRYKASESLDDAYDPEQVVVVIALDGDHAAIRGEHFRKWVPISHLSPLLTPEEIAAEAALDEIARLYHEGGPAAIYDAGYRKTTN